MKQHARNNLSLNFEYFFDNNTGSSLTMPADDTEESEEKKEKTEKQKFDVKLVITT